MGASQDGTVTKKGTRIRRIGSTCVLVLSLFACNHEPSRTQQILSKEIAPGSLEVEVISPLKNADDYWRYLITPATGTVVRSAHGLQTYNDWKPLSPGFATGRVHCSEESQAISPNQQFLARCFGEWPGERGQFLICAKDSGSVMYRWDSDSWREIDGFVWAPNSRAVALLTISEHYGKGPLERLLAASGHPVPHRTVYLDIIDVRSGRTTEYVIRNDVEYGSARILRWSEPSSG